MTLVRHPPKASNSSIEPRLHDAIDRQSADHETDTMGDTATKQPAQTYVGTSKVVDTPYPVRAPPIGRSMGPR